MVLVCLFCLVRVNAISLSTLLVGLREKRELGILSANDLFVDWPASILPPYSLSRSMASQY